ncbi:hypothetical protein PPERSA_10637 [Pseudocohnilembus persalinus]|uniref:EF-hand domain-containing protein n=1 Tax=Pseudocohnilembus persalinus TaxID=266149 RepID=A0A0V0QD67_PSEPJ|nr:hypothetical protein PPERSA_10637 [Pseudocohnilembus persalinus]|eukprot:KRX00138.1 hypothetical protein PPERSA_10637 [Pseudocohnilembus persalinus]
MGNLLAAISSNIKEIFGDSSQSQNKIFPINENDKLQKLSQRFHLDGKSIIDFHLIFRKIDKQGSGYVTLVNLFEFLKEELTSTLSPYLRRLFILIEKESNDKISFVEWLPAICVYCLYPKERIYSFVFAMIDDDHDQSISKKDMIKFLVQDHNGQKIFPINFIRAIEILEVPRSDKITFDQFKRLQQKIPFLCYPAFRLQETLKAKVTKAILNISNYNLSTILFIIQISPKYDLKLTFQILGDKFWESLYNKIKDQESKEQKQLQADKIKEEIQKKWNQKIENKAKQFDQNFGVKKLNQNLIIPILRQERQPRRRGSDGIVGINVGNLLEIKEDIYKNKKRSGSFLYIKPPYIKDKKPIINSDQEDENNQENMQSEFHIDQVANKKENKNQKSIIQKIRRQSNNNTVASNKDVKQLQKQLTQKKKNQISQKLNPIYKKQPIVPQKKFIL